MLLRERAAAVAAVIAVTGALAACAAPGDSATSTHGVAASSVSPLGATHAPDITKLAGLNPAEVLAMLGNPDLRRTEPPAELWQYRAADCVLNLFFYDENGGYRLSHVEAWQRSLAAGGSSPARCHDEDAPLKAHLISQSRL